MFFITFFPGFIAHLLVVVGLIAFIGSLFLSMIPFVSSYKIPIQFLSVLMLCFGLYLEGGIAYKEGIEKEVAELKVKLADAENKSKETNTQIVEKVVQDTKVIRVKGDTVVKYIEKNAENMDKACVIPKEVIDAHNQAATLTAAPVATSEQKPAESAPKMLLPPRTSK